MTPTAAFLFAAALWLAPASPAKAEAGVSHAGDRALQQTNAANLSSYYARSAGSPEGASELGRSAFEGGSGSDMVVSGKDSKGRPTLSKATLASVGGPTTVPGPQVPAAHSGKKAIPDWAAYATAAALGGLQGALFGGVFGALGGALVGLAVTNRYLKGDYGAAIGISAGAIVGTFLGGPIGGLIGGLVGGVIGHFLGKLFT